MGGHSAKCNKPGKDKSYMVLLKCGIWKKANFIAREKKMMIARGWGEGKMPRHRWNIINLHLYDAYVLRI